MIVATAGHVDHGKTLLVKNLTGMETDRLEEEKRRGLSINLGFAYHKTARDKLVALVDVPGHTRFINNMIAGINGIDLGMVVIAADDGVMPQTREHLNVLRLLGVSRFCLVITKIDRAEQKRIDEVRRSALGLLSGFENVPVFEVDSINQEGIVELLAFLEDEAETLEEKIDAGHFRLSIDRAFLIKGSGLVVTGTVISGGVEEGDSLQLLPQDITLRVRGLQMQEQGCKRATTGQRCALNVSGAIEKENIERGDWLVSPGLSATTNRLDVSVSLLDDAPFGLKHMSPLKLYIGAKRCAAKLAILEANKLAPGDEGFAQLLLDRPIQACHGDRFLLRDDSEHQTLGGGIVLEPFASSGKRAAPEKLLTLQAKESEEAKQVLQSLLLEHKQIIKLESFCLAWNIREDEEDRLLAVESLKEKAELLQHEGGRFLLSRVAWQKLQESISHELALAGKDAAGIERRELQAMINSQFPGVDASLVLELMQARGQLLLSRERVMPPKKASSLSAEQEKLWRVVEAYLHRCNLQVPVVGDIAEKTGHSPAEVLALCKLASKEKRLLMVANNRFILAEQARRFAGVVNGLQVTKKGFSVADFKNSIGLGRNLAVEVLECFDKIGFTLRKDSGRVVLHAERVNTLTSN